MAGLDRLVADERAVLLKVVDAQPVLWACLWLVSVFSFWSEES